MICIDDFGTCPLCGEQVSFKCELAPNYEYFQIRCECGLSFTGYDMDDLYSWNDRPERTCEDRATAEDRFSCSVCGCSCAVSWLSYCPNCGAKVVD